MITGMGFLYIGVGLSLAMSMLALYYALETRNGAWCRHYWQTIDRVNMTNPMGYAYKQVITQKCTTCGVVHHIEHRL